MQIMSFLFWVKLSLLAIQIVEIATLQQVDVGSNLIIDYHQHEQLYLTRSSFNLEFSVKKKNTASLVTDTYIRLTSSDETSITNLVLNRIAHSNPKKLNNYLLVSSFDADEQKVNLAVIIDQNGTLSAGFHVQNILIQVEYKMNGQKFLTNFESIMLPVIDEECRKIIDVDGILLKSTHVTASSYYPNTPPENFGPQNSGWCALKNEGEHIQMIFSHPLRLTSIASSGRNRKLYWITEYTLEYLTLDHRWLKYRENGQIKVFQGKENFPEANQQNWLKPSLKVIGMRIWPKKNHGKLVCARILLTGCVLNKKDTCFKAIGLANRKIVPDESFTDMFGNEKHTTPWQGRLNYDKENALNFGWHVMKERNFLQIDLGSLYKINAVVIQGASHILLSSQRVVEYYLQYSNDLDTWFYVLDKKEGTLTQKVFPGPDDGRLLKSADLSTDAVVGRSFRLLPSDESKDGILRVEMYGCLAEDHLENSDKNLLDDIGIRSLLINKESGDIHLCQRNQKRTSCFTSSISSQYRSWKALPKFIVGMSGYDREANYYGVTITGTRAIKHNSSDQWNDITNKLWIRKNREIFSKAILIKTILPKPIVDGNKWNAVNGYSVAVSGQGFHTRQNNDQAWRLVVKWSCCGN